MSQYWFFKRGIWISEGKAKRPGVKVVYRKHKHSILELVLREGKNREIRRILAQDHPVVSLKRIEIGLLKLNQSLKIGKYRRLSKVEVESLYHWLLTVKYLIIIQAQVELYILPSGRIPALTTGILRKRG